MWRVVGHPGAVRLLDRALQEGRLAHAYLVGGPPQVGKTTLALDLAAAVNCDGPAPPCGECAQCEHIYAGRHPDLLRLGVEEAEGHKAIGIDAVRDAAHKAALNPFEGRMHVAVIEGAERLTAEAANALLKLLEEPPPRLQLILLSASPGNVLATVRSRCQRIDLRPLSHAAVVEALETRWEAPASAAQELAALSGGRLGWAVGAWEDPGVLETRERRLQRLSAAAYGGLEERFEYAKELAGLMGQQRAAVRETLDLWAAWWLEQLAGQVRADAVADGAPSRGDLLRAAQAVMRTQDLLERNVNPQLALEGLMLALPRTGAG